MCLIYKNMICYAAILWLLFLDRFFPCPYFCRTPDSLTLSTIFSVKSTWERWPSNRVTVWHKYWPVALVEAAWGPSEPSSGTLRFRSSSLGSRDPGDSSPRGYARGRHGNAGTAGAACRRTDAGRWAPGAAPWTSQPTKQTTSCLSSM